MIRIKGRENPPVRLEPEEPVPAHRAVPYHPADPPSRSAHIFLATLVSFLFFLGIALAIGGIERFGPESVRPSSVIGLASGNAEYRKIVEQLEAEKARTAALTDEQSRLQREVLQAKADAEAMVIAAQSQSQQEVAAMTAKMQVLAGAYQTLFERSNMLVNKQAGLIESASKSRQQLAANLSSGKAAATNLLDTFGGLVSMIDPATGARMHAQSDETSRQALAAFDRNISAPMPQIDVSQLGLGMPDLASLLAQINSGQITPDPKVKAHTPAAIAPRAVPPEPTYRGKGGGNQ